MLNAIGVSEIVHPEEETAERWPKKLCLSGLVDSFELNPNDSIVEAIIPKKHIGLTIQQIGFRERYEILVLIILKKTERESLIGKSRIVTTVLHGIPKPDTVLQEVEIIVIYGGNQNIKAFLKN